MVLPKQHPMFHVKHFHSSYKTTLNVPTKHFHGFYNARSNVSIKHFYGSYKTASNVSRKTFSLFLQNETTCVHLG